MHVKLLLRTDIQHRKTIRIQKRTHTHTAVDI